MNGPRSVNWAGAAHCDALGDVRVGVGMGLEGVAEITSVTVEGLAWMVIVWSGAVTVMVLMINGAVPDAILVATPDEVSGVPGAMRSTELVVVAAVLEEWMDVEVGVVEGVRLKSVTNGAACTRKE